MPISPAITPTLEIALSYAARGWHVLPLHTVTPDGTCSCPKGAVCPEKTRGKHPRTAHGHHDATTDPQTIRQWWTQWPDANIGIRTGEISNLVVVDVDPRNGGHVTWEDLTAQHGRPDTAEVFTGGGGRHFYFTHAFTATKGANALGAGVDIKTDGGYVVAPPSTHASGQVYEWEVSGTAPAALPDWITVFEKSQEENVGGDRTRSNTTPCSIPPYAGRQPSMFRGPEADKACAHALGLPLTGRFSCILPGHGPDRNPSASLFVGRSGDLLYHCFHRGDLTLTLPQVRASLAYGKVTVLKDEHGKGQRGEHVVWRLRLLYEARVLTPVALPQRALPPDVKPATARVYQGLALLLGLKEHVWPGDPASFSWRFAQAWCEGKLTRHAVCGAMKWLIGKGYIQIAGRHPYGRNSVHVFHLAPERAPVVETIDWGEIEQYVAAYDRELAAAFAAGTIEEFLGGGETDEPDEAQETVGDHLQETVAVSGLGQ